MRTLHTRWCYAWAWDAEARAGTVYARNLAALHSLADGDHGADLPGELRTALARARAAAQVCDKSRVPGSGTHDQYRALPYVVVLHASGAVDCFIAINDNWEQLVARATAA